MAERSESLADPSSVSYLTQREAAEVDENLMGPLGFSVDQLMVSARARIFMPAIVVFLGGRGVSFAASSN